MMKFKQNKMKGFTLIELLAVIVILAIIALIAVPVIMNIIDKANRSTFKDTAYGIINAGELYYSERQLDLNGMSEDVTITLPDTTNTLGLKGEVPEGSIIISKEGKVALAISNARYCITKNFDDTDVTVIEDYEECKNPGEPIMTSTNSCIQAGNTCSDAEIKSDEGILVNIKVNDTENYDFYVISDNGTEITLIMDRNLGDKLAWISGSDYTTANTDGTSCSYTACNYEGPITSVAALKERTRGWTNVEEREYTYSDDGNGNKYTSFKETMRARILTLKEATILGCTGSSMSCPRWLYANLSSSNTTEQPFGYWTSAAHNTRTDAARVICSDGMLAVTPVDYETHIGIRPVIIIEK